MKDDTLPMLCEYCKKPCGELPMSEIAVAMVTLHIECYENLCEAAYRYQDLNDG